MMRKALSVHPGVAVISQVGNCYGRRIGRPRGQVTPTHSAPGLSSVGTSFRGTSVKVTAHEGELLDCVTGVNVNAHCKSTHANSSPARVHQLMLIQVYFS